jgi:hypothetical protein
LIWFGYIARLSQRGGGGILLIQMGSKRYGILNLIEKLKRENKKILKSIARYVLNNMGFPMIPLSHSRAIQSHSD